MTKDISIEEELKKFSRKVSLECFTSHSLNKAMAIKSIDLGTNSQSSTHLKSSGILWGNDRIKGLIVCRFEFSSILEMGADVLKDINDNEALAYIQDFMKEYCNLYAGFIKGVFTNNLISVDISLPIVSDFIDPLAMIGPSKVKDEWLLSSNNRHFIIQNFIKIEDNFKGYNLDFITKEEHKKSIEFF